MPPYSRMPRFVRPLRDASPNVRGVVAILIAMLLFCSNDMLMKLVVERLPSSQGIFFRGSAMTVLTFTLVASGIGVKGVRLLAQPLVALRGAMEGIGTLCFVSALAYLTLPTITAITQASPLMTTAMAALLGAGIGWRRWSATAVGFVGVLLIMQPGADGIGIPALLALFVAFLVAGRDIMTPLIPAHIPPSVLAMGAALASLPCGLALSLWQQWLTPTPGEILCIAGAALLMSSAHWLVAFAFREGEPSVVAPFRYSVVLWSGIYGLLIWGDIPDGMGLLGTGLVVASGVYIIHRETLRRRAPAAAMERSRA